MTELLEQVEMFSCPIWTCQYEGHDKQKNNLIKLLDEIRDTSANRTKGNYNTFETNRDLQTHPAMKNFIDDIGPLGNELTNVWGFEEASSLGICSMWGSITEMHGSINHHSVPFSLLYGLYFLQTPPESGHLEIDYPTQDRDFFYNFAPRTPKTFNLAKFMTPMPEGTLVFFPSHVSAFISTNISDENRYIIHFGLRVVGQ